MTDFDDLKRKLVEHAEELAVDLFGQPRGPAS